MSYFKPQLSFSQIINMNVGFFGIQYSFGLQQTAVNPIYTFLHANPDDLPILNLAGPLTGLLIQPIIGAMSDKTWHPRWGRRKPYFLIGAILCSICLFLFPFSSSLWMAVGLLWILDAGNNTAMEPYRAFVVDSLPEQQQGMGFMTQSFFTGLGITLASVSLYFFKQWGILSGTSTSGIPYWVYGSFLLGSFCSIASVLWSMRTTPELPPPPEVMDYIMKDNRHGILQPFVEIAEAISTMPRKMWQLAFVYLFQWYALFCYWQFMPSNLAKNYFGWKPLSDEQKNVDDIISKIIKNGTETIATLGEKLQNHLPINELSTAQYDIASAILKNRDAFENGASFNGLVAGWYNIVTFLSAFVLVILARKMGAKQVHFLCLLLAGASLLLIPNIYEKNMIFVAITGFGIAWASMMGIPYLLVVDSIPKERYGVYMGIINMMIVIPMLIQTVTFGYILKNFLGNDSSKAIFFAGVLMVIAALAVLRIDTAAPEAEAENKIA
jgi:maltose/moltooligosaccharide transporter